MDTLPAGQSSKSPAFSFYAKEWLAATLSWALDARGAYATLLAYQWDAGSIPGDDAAALGRMLGISSTKAKIVWAIISSKFERGSDGQWRNVRLEQERGKQTARREALATNGAKGGRPKQTETNRLSVAKPNENQNKSLSSSFSSSRSGIETESPTTRHRGVGLIVGGGEYVRLLETNAYVGQKLRVPKVLHAELITKSGTNADSELRKWYARLDEDLEQSGKGTGDVFDWLRPRHQAYALEQGWVDAAPKPSSKPVRDDAALMARLQAIERGEIKR